MKKWTGFLVVLVVLILIAYYVMGFVLERTLNKNINSIPKSPVLSVELDNYERGWFSSQALLAVKMHIPAQETTDAQGESSTEPPADVDMSFPLIINHGPFIVSDYGMGFGMGQVTTRPETHFHVLVNYFNKTIFKYAIPAFTIKGQGGSDEDSFQAEWLGLNALLCVSPNLDKLGGGFILHGLNTSASNGLFKLGRVVNNFKLSRSQEGLWVGQVSFNVPSASLSGDKDNQNFNLESFDLALGSDITDDALNVDLGLSLKQLVTNDKTYGPGVVKLSIKNLDPAAMASINKLTEKLVQDNPNATLLGVSILSELPKLLSKGAILELSEMNFNLPEGKIIGNLKISVPTGEVNDPVQLLQKAQGTGEFRAPMAIVKEILVATMTTNSEKNSNSEEDQSTPAQATAQEPATGNTATAVMPTASTTDSNTDLSAQADKVLQDLVNKGLLKVEGNDYVVSFKLENQQLMVNGQPFDPNTLK
ncbi:YdgA family protein [Legionella feeleii]|uniref:Putative virulence protein n=1 Tax=Legionella feeleii TaxID=453 RepID=A0A0W0TI29_9GAMM|nr:YdgA family protein [Legionella feeleii]KTC95238.1 putative virulence protein [Legionella feeleii]SPX62227.1 putative virulence protein [Legionella feeleii]